MLPVPYRIRNREHFYFMSFRGYIVWLLYNVFKKKNIQRGLLKVTVSYNLFMILAHSVGISCHLICFSQSNCFYLDFCSVEGLVVNFICSLLSMLDSQSVYLAQIFEIRLIKKTRNRLGHVLMSFRVV